MLDPVAPQNIGDVFAGATIQPGQTPEPTPPQRVDGDSPAIARNPDGTISTGVPAAMPPQPPTSLTPPTPPPPQPQTIPPELAPLVNFAQDEDWTGLQTVDIGPAIQDLIQAGLTPEQARAAIQKVAGPVVQQAVTRMKSVEKSWRDRQAPKIGRLTTELRKAQAELQNSRRAPVQPQAPAPVPPAPQQIAVEQTPEFQLLTGPQYNYDPQDAKAIIATMESFIGRKLQAAPGAPAIPAQRIQELEQMVLDMQLQREGAAFREQAKQNIKADEAHPVGWAEVDPYLDSFMGEHPEAGQFLGMMLQQGYSQEDRAEWLYRQVLGYHPELLQGRQPAPPVADPNKLTMQVVGSGAQPPAGGAPNASQLAADFVRACGEERRS